MRYLLFIKQNLHLILFALCILLCRDNVHVEVDYAFVWGIIPALVGAAAQGIGALVANNKKKKALAKMNRHYDNLIDETEREMNSNFLDRADSQDALRKITDSNSEALRQLNTNAIRQGATDEAKVAMANSLTKRTADAVGQLSALGVQHKDNLRRYKHNLKEAKARQTFDAESDVSGIETIVNGISQVANAFGSTYATGGAGAGATEANAALNAQTTDALARSQATTHPMMQDTLNRQWAEQMGLPYGNTLAYGK